MHVTNIMSGLKWGIPGKNCDNVVQCCLKHLTHFYTYISSLESTSKHNFICQNISFQMPIVFAVYHHNTIDFSVQPKQETLPEAQRTQGIESITWIMFLTEISLKLFWLKKIIQVTDSIPWVRCASGNVSIFTQKLPMLHNSPS